jgi:hypothetical protein
VQILHFPAADLPIAPEVRHKPMQGDEAPHFSAYYRLYNQRVSEWRPRFFDDYNDACGAAIETPCSRLRYQAASAYNCMLAADVG